MTIIAVSGDTMVADSWAFHGCIGIPTATPKIVRAPDGSLVGSAGAQPDLQTLKSWVFDGMDWGNLPQFVCLKAEDEGSVDNLWLRRGLGLYRFGPSMKPYQVMKPYTIGLRDATYLVDGMLMAGMGVEQAVTRVIERCAYVGGPIQVEHL